jgi:hypothetical protein
VGAPADVCSGKNLAVQIGGGQLLERQLQQPRVIGGGVRRGVAGAQERCQRLVSAR